MPTCQNCGQHWTWTQTIKSLFRLKCNYCGKKQYESAASRRKTGMFSLFSILVIPINMWLDLSKGTALILAVMFALIIVGLIPFLIELSNEEESLW